MRKHLGTMGILAAIVVLFATAMILGSRHATEDEESYVGSDSAATTHIEENHPGYTPWFQPLFEPSSGEVESGLFALQAGLGGVVLGFVLGTLRERRRNRGQATPDASPEGSTPSASAVHPESSTERDPAGLPKGA